jgi:hypothetical protein
VEAGWSPRLIAAWQPTPLHTEAAAGASRIRMAAAEVFPMPVAAAIRMVAAGLACPVTEEGEAAEVLAAAAVEEGTDSLSRVAAVSRFCLHTGFRIADSVSAGDGH